MLTKTEQATACATKKWKEWAFQRVLSPPPDDIILLHELLNNIVDMTGDNMNFYIGSLQSK